MPDDDTQQVSEQAGPGGALPEAATSVAMGDSIGKAVEGESMVQARVGFDHANAQKQQQAKADQIASLGGINAVQAYDLDGLHGPKGLLYQNAGVNAPQASQDFLAQRATKLAAIRATLNTD